VSAFADYSRYYAAFYRDKDYASEAEFVLGSLRDNGFGGGPDHSILELGCGQGGHAIPLAQRGVSVIGVDRSAGMIEAANGARAALPASVSSRLRFSVGDIRSWKTDEKAGGVVSLFHVMSYLPTDADLRATFENARSHLDAGAPFAFDFWFGDAVLRDEPGPRRREVEGDGARVVRTATPTIDRARHTVDVNYRFDITPLDGSPAFTFEETHAMRYLFADELQRLCAAAGFEPVILSEWMAAPSTPPQSWNGYFLARAR
jgi:SAM-dependent methyltransferase